MPTAPETTDVSSETGVEELSQEDLARLVFAFRGHPRATPSALHYVRGSEDGAVPGYVWDEASAMVWILD